VTNPATRCSTTATFSGVRSSAAMLPDGPTSSAIHGRKLPAPQPASRTRHPGWMTTARSCASYSGRACSKWSSSQSAVLLAMPVDVVCVASCGCSAIGPSCEYAPMRLNSCRQECRVLQRRSVRDTGSQRSVYGATKASRSVAHCGFSSVANGRRSIRRNGRYRRRIGSYKSPTYDTRRTKKQKSGDHRSRPGRCSQFPKPL